jgi:twitching motility protein PilT
MATSNGGRPSPRSAPRTWKRSQARLLPPVHQEKLQTKLEVDVAWQAAGVGRCRASVFKQRGTIAVSMRLIPDEIPSLETLGLPPSIAKLAVEQRGLVLVTGVTGSGKSTTLASLVDLINRTRPVHVLTIEDPIEFVHRDVKAVITQREIGFDTPGYASGLRAALRQDPDVIMIGEMRDPETIETALVAAETGHLVFSTLHTLDAPETINRIVAVFPPHQQQQIPHPARARAQSRGLAAADPARRWRRPRARRRSADLDAYIRDCIEDHEKTNLIPDAIVAGVSEYGMQSFDQAILRLTKEEAITIEEAERWVTNIDEFRMRMRGITAGSAAALSMGSMGGALERFGAKVS